MYTQVQLLQDVDAYLESLVLLFNISIGVKLEIVQPQQGNFNPYIRTICFILLYSDYSSTRYYWTKKKLDNFSCSWR